MKKLTVIKKIVHIPCYCCNEGLYGNAKPRKECKECNGSGKYKEYHYMYIVGNMAIDSDTLK